MKKLLLALAIGTAISTGASAVTCGENQQPDYTNSYCVDDPQATTTNYSSVYELYKDLDTEEQKEFVKPGCDQMYQVFLTQLIKVREQTTLICDAVCKVKRSSFLPLGEFSDSEDISMKLFNDQLRWIATAVMKKDPELTSGDSIYYDFLKTCNANPYMVVRLYQRGVDLKFGGDVNKALKYLGN
jgi:hypothetical protein